jgi:hypothetical protein
MKDRQSQMQPRDDSQQGKAILAGGREHPAGYEAMRTASPLSFRAVRLPARLRQRLGAVLLATVVLVVFVVRAWSPDPAPDLTVVHGYGGELKVNFFNDPEVARILAEEYGLEVDITGIGSVELACGRPFDEDDDFVWLGDSVALEKYRDLGCTMVRADNVYNSPMVFYSWTPIVDALVTAGVAQTAANGAYTLDFAHLVELMMSGTTWAQIGLANLHGGIIVQTTDPNRSNSGLLFSGLLANTMNGGPVVNPTTVIPLLPDIQSYFDRLGLMEATSGSLFEQFLITGPGAKPMVALYESQLMEFLGANPQYQQQIAQQVRVIYPEPTVWATHPLVARTADGDRLLDALKDPDIQRLAWEKHGQRPGVPQFDIDLNAMPIPGILPKITSVTSMPSWETMNLILDAISGTLPPGTPVPTVAPLVSITTLALLARVASEFRGWSRHSLDWRRTMFTLKPGRILVRRVRLAMVLLGLLGPGAVTAQAVIDVMVIWTAPFEERTGIRTVPQATHEFVLVHQDDTVVVANGDFDPAPARIEALEALGGDTENWISVDAGASGDPQPWLDLVDVEGEPYGAFPLARAGTSGTTMTLFMGPATTFAAGMGQTQQAVLVDGTPIFDGVEPAGLQSLLELEVPNLDAASLGDNDTDDGPTTEEESDDIDALADMPGMIGEGSYASPHHGFALTWTDEWILDPLFEEPVTSDVNFDVDQVYLTVDSPQWVWSTFIAASTQGLSFAEVFSSVTSPSSISQFYGETGELAVSRMGITSDGYEVGAFIVRYTSPEGDDFIAYEEWRLSDDRGAVAGLQLLMLVDDMEPGLEASDDLEIDGEPVITLFTHAEILSAADDAVRI